MAVIQTERGRVVGLILPKSQPEAPDKNPTTANAVPIPLEGEASGNVGVDAAATENKATTAKRPGRPAKK